MTLQHKITVIPREKAVFRMDGNGTWHNEHGRFEHPKIITHFNRSIQWDDQGFFLSQMMDDQREEKVYFPYEETAVFVVGVRSGAPNQPGAPITLILNTGASLLLAPDTLFIRRDSLYIKGANYPIKFNQQALAEMARFMDDTPQGLTLVLGKTTTLIPEA